MLYIENPENAYKMPPKTARFLFFTYRLRYIYAVRDANENFNIKRGAIKYGTASLLKGIVSQKKGLDIR